MSKKRKIQKTKRELIKEHNENINWYSEECNKWRKHYIIEKDISSAYAIQLENSNMERDFHRRKQRVAESYAKFMLCIMVAQLLVNITLWFLR